MYADWTHSIKHLTDEQAGQVLKHLLAYVNDENPQTNDPIINITFEPIKQQLKRDLDKWDKIRAKRSDAGRKSAEKRAEQKAANSTSVESVKQTATNSTVTVNDNVNVNVTVNDNVIKKTLLDRETDFKKSLQPFLQQYGSDMLNDFFMYWTEKKPKGRKMLYEMQRTFDVKKRLIRWNKNNFNNKNHGNSKDKQQRFDESNNKLLRALDN